MKCHTKKTIVDKLKNYSLKLKSKPIAILPFLVLFLAQQIIYHRLSFTPLSSDYKLGGDLLVFHYPINLFNSDAYRAGIVPLWNPYVHSGFPWITGLEYKVFYPVQMLVSLLFGYSYQVMQIEFMLTLLFGGIGLFLLLRQFNLVNAACYFGAISFMSSGIFVGNSQHFGQLIVYAFVPWVLLQLFKLYATNDVKHAVYGAILLAVMVTGGYAGTYIVFAYILAILCFVLVVLSSNSRRLTINLLIMGGLAIGLAAVHLLPGISGFKLTSRAAGLSYEMAVVEHSLAPTDLLSAVLPTMATYSVFEHGPELSQSVSMRNFHLGTLLPWMLIIALFYSKSRRFLWFVFGLSLMALLAAMGDATFIRPLSYQFLPAMDKLRLNSAIFRGFTMFGFCVIAAFGLHYIHENIKKWKGCYAFLVLPLVIALVISLSRFTNEQKQILLWDVLPFSLVIIFFVAIYVAFKSHKISAKTFAGLLVMLLVCEFAYAVQVNSSTLWSYDPEFRKGIAALEAARDRSFQQLGKGRREYQFPDEWYSNFTPLVRHIPSDYGPSSTMLSYYEEYLHTQAYREARAFDAWKSPLVFPDMLVLYDDEQGVVEHLNSLGVASTKVVAGIVNSGEVPGQRQKLYSGDASFGGFARYTLNAVEFAYRSDANRLALFNQAYSPGWGAFVKETGESVPLSRVNLAFTGLELPAGQGTVLMKYEPKEYFVGKWISFLFILLTGYVLFMLRTRTIRKELRIIKDF